MRKVYRESIAREFRNCVTNTIKRLENEETYRPFHTALLSDEALFWSRFERSFSTSFGQRVVEEVSKIVAVAGGATSASRQKGTIISLDKDIITAIDAHITSIRDGAGMKTWSKSIEEIKNQKLSGVKSSIRVISDLWWLKGDTHHYVSIKTVKPNIDQTAVAKKDLLLLSFADPSCKTYFGLYYNPYGEDKTSYAHNPPMKIFDFQHDEVVLIGREYWDTIGGDGCYDEVLEIAKQVGTETREIIKKLK